MQSRGRDVYYGGHRGASLWVATLPNDSGLEENGNHCDAPAPSHRKKAKATKAEKKRKVANAPALKIQDTGVEKFWNDLTKLLRNYDLEKDYFFEMLKKQFKEKSRHTVDYKQLKSIII